MSIEGCCNAFFQYFPFRAHIIDNWTDSELQAAYKQAYVPGSTTSVFYNLDLYPTLIKHQQNRTDPPKLLKDCYMLESRALVFGPNHYFFEIFDQKLQQYIEGDFINFNNRKWMEENNPKRQDENKKPFAVLTLDELEAGFVACIAPFVLSILVFVLEWIRTLKDIMIFFMIFKTLFEVKDLEQINHNSKMKINVARWQKLSQKKKMEKIEFQDGLGSAVRHDQENSKFIEDFETVSLCSYAWSEDLDSFCEN